jgi:hypothetical protein
MNTNKSNLLKPLGLTKSEYEGLRALIMERMSPLCKRYNDWRDWPGTVAFASVAIEVMLVKLGYPTKFRPKEIEDEGVWKRRYERRELEAHNLSEEIISLRHLVTDYEESLSSSFSRLDLLHTLESGTAQEYKKEKGSAKRDVRDTYIELLEAALKKNHISKVQELRSAVLNLKDDSHRLRDPQQEYTRAQIADDLDILAERLTKL